MTDFLNKISGQITGSMIIGAFFPAVLFLLTLALVVLPVTPYGKPLTNVVSSGKLWDEKGAATLIGLAIVLVLSILLYFLNVSIVRFYEGYPWRKSVIGLWMAGRERRQFDRATQLRKRIAKLRKEIRLLDMAVDVSKAAVVQRDVVRLLNDEFPSDASLVLPTRLGNVVRAFQTYTTRQYGAPLIALWPRLQNVLESDRAQAIDNVKSGFDFMINCSFLSAVLALFLTGAGFYWQKPLDARFQQSWVAWDVFLILISWLAYLGAIERAVAWGAQMKASFDLYRRTLLDKLGYAEVKPADLREERRIWQIVNYKLSMPDEPSPDIPYRSAPISLIVDPIFAAVTFSQTLSQPDDKTTIVTAVVKNAGPHALPADGVILRAEVPAGTVFVASSATVNGAPATLRSTNPLMIDLGALPFYESRTVSFTFKAQP